MEPEVKTLEDLIKHVAKRDLSAPVTRDMVSAIRRVADMSGQSPTMVEATPIILRDLLSRIEPAAHRISAKTWANIRSLVQQALVAAGIVDDRGRGAAGKHAAWASVMKLVADDKRLAAGLSGFANWCSVAGVEPDAVGDRHVLQFLDWMEARTLVPKPRDQARIVPVLWNRAVEKVDGWPKQRLTPISFKQPNERLGWAELPETFRGDVQAYLKMREKPARFDENAPRKPLKPQTIRLQGEHLRLAASVTIKGGRPAPKSLADLVKPENVEFILGFYDDEAGQEPSAFNTGMATTLRQVANYHVRLPSIDLQRLKSLASMLPAVPLDLTEKNKKVLRQFESDRMKAKLLHLPEKLLAATKKSFVEGRLRHADAAAGVAIGILLYAPLRPQNVISLNWQKHFSEPDGSRGLLLLHIPKDETKTQKRDLVFDLPADIARLIRWYRREVHSRVGADPNGSLFVNGDGKPKKQETLAVQMEDAIRRHLGIRMTPHQFRHLAAVWYLDAHPEDFTTVQDLLGHGWSRTTRIYAGSSTRRAGRAYANLIVERRQSLKLTGRKPPRRKPS